MKQLISLLVLLTFTVSIDAYDFSAENAEGITIYYNYINNGTEVEVTYEGYYKSWNSKTLEYDYYYRGCSTLYGYSVTIPETVSYNNHTFPVTQIGRNAFRDNYMQYVILPNSIKSIGSYSFQDSSIKEITIPDGITELKNSIFAGCKYLNKVNLPEGIKVIGSHVFDGCKSLTTITIPESVTVLEGFTNCSGLTTFTIPKNVTSVYFYGCENLLTLYSYIEDPQDISYPSTAFSKNTYYSGTLYVPKGTIEKYRSKEGWKNFTWIEEMSGSSENKCSTPVMSVSNKELKYDCATNGATIHETITCPDVATTVFSGSHKLNAVYEISAYATANGYSQSETITAKLYWVDGSLNTSNINSVSANTRGVLIQCDDDFLKVSGLNNNEPVSLYDISGKIISSAKSVDGTAIFSVNKALKVVVVKVGNDSIKVPL